MSAWFKILTIIRRQKRSVVPVWYNNSYTSQPSCVSDLDADFITYPEAQTITEEEPYIRIPCQAPPSNPPAVISWYKDNVLIEVRMIRCDGIWEDDHFITDVMNIRGRVVRETI